MNHGNALLSALLKLHENHPRPLSAFTSAQRRALDQFARQTGAIGFRQSGRGDICHIVDPGIFNTHLHALSPLASATPDPSLSARARNIGHARNSKAGRHRHQHHYLLLRSMGANVQWHDPQRNLSLPLGLHTLHFGASSLRISPDDGWQTADDLWLIENQLLFDENGWLPADASGTLLYYQGQLNNNLLQWLGTQRRARRVIHFPDYDGVGLSNFARLHAVLEDGCECWLMPNWEEKLARYGSSALWRDTRRALDSIQHRLPPGLQPLLTRMRESGLALEQEAVLLPPP